MQQFSNKRVDSVDLLKYEVDELKTALFVSIPFWEFR